MVIGAKSVSFVELTYPPGTSSSGRTRRATRSERLLLADPPPWDRQLRFCCEWAARPMQRRASSVIGEWVVGPPQASLVLGSFTRLAVRRSNGGRRSVPRSIGDQGWSEGPRSQDAAALTRPRNPVSTEHGPRVTRDATLCTQSATASDATTRRDAR